MSGHKHVPFSIAEYVAAIAIMLIASALGLFTYYLYKARNYGPAIVFGGLDMILLGGVFDPVNALWLLIPFTGKPLIRRPYSFEHKILRRTGFAVVILGIAYWYNGKVWVPEIRHMLRHIKIP